MCLGCGPKISILIYILWYFLSPSIVPCILFNILSVLLIVTLTSLVYILSSTVVLNLCCCFQAGRWCSSLGVIIEPHPATVWAPLPFAFMTLNSVSPSVQWALNNICLLGPSLVCREELCVRWHCHYYQYISP